MACWEDGPLGKSAFKTAPSSHLAVMSRCQGQILLCYQDVEGNIRLAHGGPKEVWRPGVTIQAQDAIPHSSLAILSFQRDTGDNSIRLYYQAENPGEVVPVFKELQWERLKVDFHPDDLKEPVRGQYSCPAPPGASIAAVAWADPSLEIRIFAGRSRFVVQYRFGFDEWSEWPLVLKDIGGKRFAAGRLESSNVCVLYFIDGNGRVAEMKDAYFHGRHGLESTAKSKMMNRFLVTMMRS
jgi:hypothetical protein